MDIKASLFYLASFILLFSAIRVITSKNTVHSVLFLVLTFTQAAVVWMLLGAEFLSIALVLVYVGAVMILFLFVVMMLDVRKEDAARIAKQHLPLAGLIVVLISVEMSSLLISGFNITETAARTTHQIGQQVSNTKALGILMYTEYFYPIEVAAAILLVGMIVAIALTLRRRKDSKHIDPSEQVRVKARDRLEIISFPKQTQGSNLAGRTEES
ncbi:MAG: NADH-quinone oxidoreductase subunit J [Rhodoferax sp.]